MVDIVMAQNPMSNPFSPSPKVSLTNLIIDRTLVSTLDRAVEKFTVQDVRGETIDMGYKVTPSTSSIFGRLDGHTNANLLRQVSERAGPCLSMFEEYPRY